MVRTIARPAARRIALAAQGFTDPAHAVPTMRTLVRTVNRTGVLQVDSVNVLTRAHYMPLYSRMGPYEPDLLHRAYEVRPRRLVEYWAHVQALMPVELWPYMQHRMDHYHQQRGKWGMVAEPAFADDLLAAIAERGASTARELDTGAERSKEDWGWNWSQARQGLDFLFLSGRLAIAGRTNAFEPRYDLPERVIPAAVLAQPTPEPAEARLELIRRAARSHGIATAGCLADYYRMGVKHAQVAIDRLVGDGELEPVRIEGWRRPGYLHAEARRPRTVSARTLLSPFDPLVWERNRTESLFDFHYRIEIYVPAHKRRHGYYVLPFLLGDRIVGRVDLKADRAAGTLLVKGAFAEPDAPDDTATELSAELVRMAGWLGAERIVVEPNGDLAPALSRAV